MKSFTDEVMARNPADMNMKRTDFWRWMLEQDKLSSRQMVTIPLYLESLGCRKGRDTVSSRTIRLLGHIHSHYWWVRNQARSVSHPVGYYELVDSGERNNGR